jgi:hypothetical protein
MKLGCSCAGPSDHADTSANDSAAAARGGSSETVPEIWPAVASPWASAGRAAARTAVSVIRRQVRAGERRVAVA